MNTFPPKNGVSLSTDDLKFNDGFCKRCNVKLHPQKFSDYCNRCKYIIEEESENKKKSEYLDTLKEKTIEQRISLIEEWIYNHKIAHPSKEYRMR